MNDNTKIELHCDIDVCKVLWNKFSPNKSIFDLWEFRYCFWEEYRFKLHFIVLLEDGKEVGLLPLWHNNIEDKYFWFGDVDDKLYWQEDNEFWVNKRENLELLLDACPRPATLYNLKEDLLVRGSRYEKFIEPWNPKNIIDLSNISCVDDYLNTLGKKLRQNLRRDFKKIESSHPIIEYDNIKDLGKIIQLNKAKFLNSPFRDKKMIAVMERLATSKTFKATCVSVNIDGQIMGGTLIFLHNKTYYPMVCGHDTEKASGIGNYLNIIDVQEGLKLNMDIIDFLEGEENSYKNKFCTQIPQFILRME